MIPNIVEVAKDVAERMSRDVVPRLTGFEANNVAMSAAMIGMMAEHWDKAASDLVAENTSLLQILALGAASGFGPYDGPFDNPLADLRVHALSALNARLRQALITLHAAVEDADSPVARQIEAHIWAELRASTERRKISAGNF
ncbi:hypothetical protein [Aquisediminimonas sediminicola]|uniref:hypothetical protein n=1 Tax=Alteraquisediminimonas sediminicola TaxID=2676787 RepID=UPI001C8D3C4D|nr:hypothetical protein [Aquisediminimonas sediminicola]